ncbi:hypothetical protein cypCar_00009923 [Cyprinus carpio]|nr:hypothetical protein cypCar_00009923 [Cyprinus carpio]
MLLSFRPLISVSVLTLLGWCWYSFSRRRTTMNPTQVNMCCSARSSPLYSSPADSSILGESLLKACKKVKAWFMPGYPETYIDQPNDLSMDHSNSGSSEIKNLTSTSSKTGLTKGVRPEPEGEVSVRFPETLQTEQEKDNVAGEGHPDCGEVSEDDSRLESDLVCLSSNHLATDSHTLTEQQSGAVRLDSHNGSSLTTDGGLNQENLEKISSVQQTTSHRCSSRGLEKPGTQ